MVGRIEVISTATKATRLVAKTQMVTRAIIFVSVELHLSFLRQNYEHYRIDKNHTADHSSQSKDIFAANKATRTTELTITRITHSILTSTASTVLGVAIFSDSVICGLIKRLGS